MKQGLCAIVVCADNAIKTYRLISATSFATCEDGFILMGECMVWNVAIGGAIIAAGASVLSLINSKEAKISEFRQQWIDALREDLTTLITAAVEIHGDIHGEDNSKFVAALDKANFVATRIGLRLNENEQQSLDLLEKLAHLRNALHDVKVLTSENSFAEVEQRSQVAIKAGQVLLKSEWNRVKHGEPTYQWTRRLVLASFISLAVLWLFDLVRPDLLAHSLTLVRHLAGYKA